MMKDFIVGEVLGKVVAYMHVIEFQKRGLPHAHILLILFILIELVAAELPQTKTAQQI